MGGGERIGALFHPPIVRPKPIPRKAAATRPMPMEFLDSAKPRGHFRLVPAGSPDDESRQQSKKIQEQEE
jgi:hypothetical protein